MDIESTEWRRLRSSLGRISIQIWYYDTTRALANFIRGIPLSPLYRASILTDTSGLASSSEIQRNIWGQHKYNNMGASSATRKHSSTDTNETADIGQGIDETLGR